MVFLLAESAKVATYYIREVAHSNLKNYKIVQSFEDVAGLKLPKAIRYYGWYKIADINRIMNHLQSYGAEIIDV